MKMQRIVRKAVMSLAVLLAVSTLLFPVSSEADMVPSNILQRVFALRLGTQQATGFTIEVDGRQYLITARHLLLSSKTLTDIEILHNGRWVKVSFRVILPELDTVDIAVLALPQQLSTLLPIQLGIKSSYLSQEVFFVGFPYGLFIDRKALNSGFPLPLVKHGIIAAFANERGEPFLVDGINNPGFSGGPVVNASTAANPTIIGVVSGYRAVQEPVRNQDQDTNMHVAVNTGLLVAYGIEYAVEAIKKNPIGFRVQPDP